MGYRRAITAGFGALTTLLACNALTGVGDLQAVDCADGCDGSAPVRTGEDASDADGGGGGGGSDGAVEPIDAATQLDAEADAAPDAPTGPTGPTYCQGISLYLPFDGTTTASSGQPADAPVASMSFVTGKFGQAADFTNAGGIALYYATSVGAKLGYSLAAGSVAMWVKPSWSPPCNANAAVLWKPRSSHVAALPNAGPVVECTSILGIKVDQPDTTTVSAGFPSVPMNWNAFGNWKHLVGTWAATSPTLAFSVNGGAAVASPTPWVPNDSPPTFMRIGSEISAPRSMIDEVIVWTRVLSATEIAELAASTVSAGTACGL